MLNNRILWIILFLLIDRKTLTQPKRIPCLQCFENKTRAMCNRGRIINCTEDDVCVKSLTWSPIRKKLNVSSRCESKCVEQDEGKDICRNISAPRVLTVCRHCCAKQSCGQKLSEFRDQTIDLMFRLTLAYTTQPSRRCIGHTLKNIIARCVVELRKIKHLLAELTMSFNGGVDFIVERFEPFGDSKYKARVKIMVTTLKNVIPPKEIKIFLGTFFDHIISSNRSISQGIDPSHTTLPVLVSGNEKLCPALETRLANGVIIHWPASYQGDEVSVLCYSYSPTKFDPRNMATSRCQQGGIWSSVITAKCEQNQLHENFTLEPSTTSDIADLKSKSVESRSKWKNLPFRRVLMSPILDDAYRQIEEWKKNKQTISIQYLKIVFGQLKAASTKEQLSDIKIAKKVLKIVSQLIDVLNLNEIYKKYEIPHKVRNIINRLKKNLLLETKFESVNMALVVARVSKANKLSDFITGTGNLGHNNKVYLDVATRQESSLTERFAYIKIPIKANFENDNNVAIEYLDISMYINPLLYTAKKGNATMPSGTLGNQSIVNVNSWIVDATLPGMTTVRLKENVTLTFRHINKKHSFNPQCVYWENTTSTWQTDGCVVIKSDENSTTCSCNHLTSFTLLMNIYNTSLPEIHKKILSWISVIGVGISIAALFFTLLTYSLFKRVRSGTPSKIVLNLCWALFLTNILFLVAIQDVVMKNEIACGIVAFLLHFHILASFAWMLTNAFYLYLALIQVFRVEGRHFVFRLSLFGWGVPLLVVILTGGVNMLSTKYEVRNSELCWLTPLPFYIAFVAPVGAILFFNFIVFVMVVRRATFLSSHNLIGENQRMTIRQLKGAAGVATLLGLTWVFAFVAIDIASIAFSYLFAIFNTLQGFFVSIFYCVLKTNTWVYWKRFINTNISPSLFTNRPKTPSEGTTTKPNRSDQTHTIDPNKKTDIELHTTERRNGEEDAPGQDKK